MARNTRANVRKDTQPRATPDAAMLIIISKQSSVISVIIIAIITITLSTTHRHTLNAFQFTKIITMESMLNTICKLQTLQTNHDMFNAHACRKPPCANDPLDWQHGKVQPDKTLQKCGTPPRANDPLDWQRGRVQPDQTSKTCGKPPRASDPLDWHGGK